MSNPSMPGLLKVGMTMRSPLDRAKELFATGLPTPFKIEIAKRVLTPKQKEKTLHILLSKYTDRVSPNREFFRVSVEEVKVFFELMDGEVEDDEDEDEEEDEEVVEEDAQDEEDEEDEDESATEEGTGEEETTDEESITYEPYYWRDERLLNSVERRSNEFTLGSYCENAVATQERRCSRKLGRTQFERVCRDMTKCFTNGQRIRHTIGKNNTWIGIYDSAQEGIVFDGHLYTSISKFAVTHYSNVNNTSENKKSANGWRVCECEVNGQWISTYNL
jgi:hypothetical protein